MIRRKIHIIVGSDLCGISHFKKAVYIYSITRSIFLIARIIARYIAACHGKCTIWRDICAPGIFCFIFLTGTACLT